MKTLISIHAALAAIAGFAGTAEQHEIEPIRVEVRQTATGPRLFVDGEVRKPRFFYGSPTCLHNLSSVGKTTLKVPFAAEADTAAGRVALTGYEGIDPMWFSNAVLVDLTSGTTNVVRSAAEGEYRGVDYVADGLSFVKGHRYHFIVTHRATRFRTYFRIAVSYRAADGRQVKLPYYYGDTLGDTVRLAAGAGVDFVTFSTDSSWGCENWWTAPGEPDGYDRLDRECERLIAINPKVLIVPRLMTDAPGWMLKRHPEMKMIFDTGFKLTMSSVSSWEYRHAACEAIERVARHLREKFPRNFAGLQISGQNSAEWFYMLSQTENLSGYDPATRDAFRLWLKDRGDAGWATAEVPASSDRHKQEKDARLLAFTEFRQHEVASFLLELGAAAKRGSDGGALVCFFYGYSWELGGVQAGAGETGHYAFDWLLKNAHGKIDAFSSPVSYSRRNLLGSTIMMSPAETVLRRGYLWFNEIDHRTHHEEMWDHSFFTPYTDPAITREMFLRDSAADILRGYGDWWMDLYGRGWFRDEEIWTLRRELDKFEQAMASRKAPYSPAIASVVHEPSFWRDGWGKNRGAVLDRRGFATCGADYGQYLLADVLENPPPSVKLFYLTVADNLSSEDRTKLEALKKSRPDAVFVENPTPSDLTAEAIAARATKAGVHRYTAPGKANICSAEGYLAVQALADGPLEIDFGAGGEVIDVLTGKTLGRGPKLTLSFRKGENKLLHHLSESKR